MQDFNAASMLHMILIIVISSLLVIAPVRSDVVYAEEQGFEVLAQVEIALPAKTIYDSMINDVDQWWSSSHTFYGDQKSLSISAAVGGCFCEFKNKHQQAIHLEVIHVDDAKLIRFNGGLGPLQSMPVVGVMDWQITSASLKSTVSFRYKVSGYVKGGLKNIAAPVDHVLQQQLDSFKQHIESKKAQ
jgi:hypothetical protein